LSTFIIFGATGAVGGFLLPQLLARGERIHAPSRNPSTAAAAGVTWTHGDLYGEEAKVHFVAHLRDEQKFESVDDLVAQMHRDCDEARRRLRGS